MFFLTAIGVGMPIRFRYTKAYISVNKAAGYTDDDSININIASEEAPVIIFGDTSKEQE